MIITYYLLLTVLLPIISPVLGGFVSFAPSVRPKRDRPTNTKTSWGGRKSFSWRLARLGPAQFQ